jgi:nudix-type nucleoside diphosphatase (YffH/AdpP family)
MTEIIATDVAYKGYVTITRATLRGEDGATHIREIEDHGRAVCVLPYDPERRVAMLVRMPRAPLLYVGEAEQLFEAPAGMIDQDESPEAAMRREAVEEAGLSLGALEPIATVWPSPGVSAERSSLFLATYSAADRTDAGGGLAGEHEAITVMELPLADLAAMADAGRLTDLKTLALTLALRLRQPRLFGP